MGGTTRILVVEDQYAIAVGLRDDLEAEGYHVDVAADGVEGEQAAREGGYDLILLDLMLPKKDGFAVCRTLRTSGVRTPIIVLTARAQEADKVLGLELGADDYITKPFSSPELRARVRAVLRRAVDAPPGPATFERGDLVVDFNRYEARRGDMALALTPTEYRLLAVLVRNKGRVLSVDELIDQVWGKGIALTDRVVYTHVNKLRAKIERDSAHPVIVIGVRGVGYRLGD
ncbi:MAG: two component transcriptional regulator, winged helix family [candidate division NC10 bacterium]|nr:two component transcriptional regulator, winged helix family [candidate division NC10 bacterium]